MKCQVCFAGLARELEKVKTMCDNAQCVLCAVYFSTQLNKFRTILEFKTYYPIEHTFVPACSSAWKIHFLKF